MVPQLSQHQQAPSNVAQLFADPPPSKLHLLLRLLSLVYFSPTRTAAFYADILVSLFPPEAVTELNNDLSSSIIAASDNGVISLSPPNAAAPTAKRGKGKAPPSPPKPTIGRNASKIAQQLFDPHVAIHARALVFHQNKEYYSAIGLVRDLVEPASVERCRGAGRSDAPSTSASTSGRTAMPLKMEQGLYESTPDGVKEHGCLACAHILAMACVAVGRFEEGRKVLHEANVRSKESKHIAAEPVLPPLQPHSGSPSLLLAELCRRSNKITNKAIDLSKPVEGDPLDSRGDDAVRGQAGSSPPPDLVAAYYLEALAEDGWLWEAWTGICDSGSFTIGVPFETQSSRSTFMPAVPASLVPGLVWQHLDAQLKGDNVDRRRTRSNTGINVSPSAQTSSSQTSTTSNGRKLSPLPHSYQSMHMVASTSSGPGGLFTPVAAEAANEAALGFQFPPPPAPAGGDRIRAANYQPSGNTTFQHLDMQIVKEARMPRFAGFEGSPFQPTATSTPAMASHGIAMDGSTQMTPSITGMLFPYADKNVDESINGNGKPPVTKRARRPVNGPSKSLLEMQNRPADSTSIIAGPRRRNATGRNVSDPRLSDDLLPVRRSSRLKQTAQVENARPGFTRTRSNLGMASHTTDSDDDFLDENRTRKTSCGSSDVVSPPSPTRASFIDTPLDDSALMARQTAADTWLLSLVCRFATAYQALAAYNCTAAITQLDQLPLQIRSSGTALSMYARAYYEMMDYKLARVVYERLRVLEPYRLSDMEYFATLLWHLGDAPALSFLAQSLIAVNRESPEAWIATGNCLSLQREYDEALRCFRRAATLDPSRAYAYTLSGHEAVEMDEYDRAISFYQMAIRSDVRHYNAWYGLGLVYQKTGKLRYAEYYLRRAVKINPSNPILLCCVGTILEKRLDISKAFKVYERALRLSPDNHVVQFKRIRGLVSLGRNAEALPALEDLAVRASQESNVVYLLGKLYRMTGQIEKSTIAFTHARDLNPKLSASIKAFIEGHDDGGEETMDEADGGEAGATVES